MPNIRDLPKVVSVIKGADGPEYIVLSFENYKKFIQKVEFLGAIDDEDYLVRYPDVAKAVQDKKVPSALEHYLKSGYAEGRAAKLSPVDPKSSNPPSQKKRA
jgi:hypothetical protein